MRVCGWDTPYPHAHEWSYFPGPDRVGRAMRRICCRVMSVFRMKLPDVGEGVAEAELDRVVRRRRRRGHARHGARRRADRQGDGRDLLARHRRGHVPHRRTRRGARRRQRVRRHRDSRDRRLRRTRRRSAAHEPPATDARPPDEPRPTMQPSAEPHRRHAPTRTPDTAGRGRRARAGRPPRRRCGRGRGRSGSTWPRSPGPGPTGASCTPTSTASRRVGHHADRRPAAPGADGEPHDETVSRRAPADRRAADARRGPRSRTSPTSTPST